MICPGFADPKFLFFTEQTSSLVYYSHLSSIAISLLIGFFVFYKNRNSLLSRLLFLITIVFSVWTLLSLITWTNNNSDIIIFDWSLDGLVYSVLCILVLYFFYVFVDKKDISFQKKIILFILLFPIIILTSTKYNLNEFDSVVCGIFREGFYFTNYYYFLGLVISFWVLIAAFLKYKKASQELKRQIVYLTLGVEFFLLAFFVNGFLASYLVDKGITNDFSLDQYGLFGMTFFMAVLAYMIVKFKAFEIKLLGAQALVVAIAILVGSQFFFVKTATNMILTGITFVLVAIFGWWLVKSVKLESQRKEQLQFLADQLAQGNDKLQKLDNAKSEFLSIASHQLRTPPTAIKGYSSLLLEGSYGKLTDEQSAALNNVYKRNEDMIALIDNLLETSRIESETIRYETKTFKLDELLQDIYETLIFKAKEKKLSLEFIYPKEPLPEITTDKDRFREVVSNLVDNAVKYTKEGGVKVKTELQKGFTVLSHGSANSVPVADAEKEDQERDVIRITVSDTGIGIPKTELPFLFQKFSRGKDISRLNVSGTGLGLFVGKEIMEALGGHVWAESEGEGKGSTFVVEVPVKGKETEELGK